MTDEEIKNVCALMSDKSLRIMWTEESEEVVAYVMMMVRDMIEFWEKSNVVLDPVQREVVIDSIVLTQTAAGKVFFGLLAANNNRALL